MRGYIKKYQRTHSIDINGINGGGVVKQLSKTWPPLLMPLMSILDAVVKRFLRQGLA